MKNVRVNWILSDHEFWNIFESKQSETILLSRI